MLEEFSLKMEAYRSSADSEAKTLKDSYVTLEKLRVTYEKFDAAERQMADQVLGEWALSNDEGTRFDALALIDELKIATSVPVLHELAARLASSISPGAPYELKKIYRIIDGLIATGVKNSRTGYAKP